jgi:hypothetical protein
MITVPVCGRLPDSLKKETTMKYGFLALALTAFVAFAAQPVLAECAGHTKTASVPSQTTIADGMTKQSKPSGG